MPKIKPMEEKLRADFENLRNSDIGQKLILKEVNQLLKNTDTYLAPWYALSREDGSTYPNQGLLTTPHDYLDYHSPQMLPQETIVKTLTLRHFFLQMSNHPYRINFLKQATGKNFIPPPPVSCRALEAAISSGLSLSIGDIGASVVGSTKPRVSRSKRYAQGPFVKLGKQARGIFVGSSSPDVWNSAPAIATMAASHSLATIPRNGVTSDIKRQTDLAIETFSWLSRLETEILKGRPDRKYVSEIWKNNICAALEASSRKALSRAIPLFRAGVRTFRIYSPEPGTGAIDTLKVLRKEFGSQVEIFTGQIIDVAQAKKAEELGSDGLFVGIGGGGRCITGVRSGSAIDWPSLVWQLRGEINIPIIVEGGASDHVAITLLLGASGISVSRVVSGGTIESPGGALFCSDEKGRLFKPYGGEASARTKYLDGKVLPFDVPSFVEGETTQAKMSYVKHVLPTLTYNLHLLTEDAILAMVFRNVESLAELHALDPSPLRQTTSFDQFQRNTH